MIIIVNVPTPSMIRGMRVGRSWVRIPPESRGISNLALTAPSQSWECYGSSGKTQTSITHPNFPDLDIINTGTIQGGSMDLVNTGTIQGGSMDLVNTGTVQGGSMDLVNTGTIQGGSMDLVNTGTVQGGSKRGLCP